MGGIFVSAIGRSYRQLAKVAGRLLDRVSNEDARRSIAAEVKIA